MTDIVECFTDHCRLTVHNFERCWNSRFLIIKTSQFHEQEVLFEVDDKNIFCQFDNIDLSRWRQTICSRVVWLFIRLWLNYG